MNIKKIRNVNVFDDLHIIEVIDDLIVTNYDRRGIRILDLNLETIKNIEINEDLSIDNIYKHYRQKKILLYGIDNEYVVLVDLEDYSHKVFQLPNDINNVIWSPIYYWKDNKAIFTSYSNDFFLLDVEKGTINYMDSNVVKDIYPTFYSFYNFLSNTLEGWPFQVCMGLENYYIVDEKDLPIIQVYNNYHTIINKINRPNLSYHDIIFANGVIAFVAEAGIQMVTSADNVINLLPNEGYEFLRARLLFKENIIYLITLSGDITYQGPSQINIYQLL